MAPPPRRPSMGRQKIEIRRIESDEARQVCFSKRRAGLFKKASELSILCGADVAAVVFSPAGKAFSFGHPSVESVVERFLSSSSSSPSSAAAGGGAAGEDRAVAELNRQHGDLRAQLDAEKARQERADEAIRREREARSAAMAWIDADLGAMGHDELVAFWAALAGVQAAVAASADQLLRDALLVGRRGGRQQLQQQPAAAAQLAFDLGAFGGIVGMQVPPPPPPPPGFAGVELQLQGFGGGQAAAAILGAGGPS